MRIKKKLALTAITAALLTVLAGTSTPVSAATSTSISICDLETTNFDIWLAKKLARC